MARAGATHDPRHPPPHGLLDLRALDQWNRANARSRAEYAAHPVVAGGTNRYLKTCDHCTAAKENR